MPQASKDHLYVAMVTNYQKQLVRQADDLGAKCEVEATKNAKLESPLVELEAKLQLLAPALVDVEAADEVP